MAFTDRQNRPGTAPSAPADSALAHQSKEWLYAHGRTPQQCSERHTRLAQTTSLPQANKKGPRSPLILHTELRSSDPTHAGGHSPNKGAGGCGSLGLSPRRVLRGYPIGLGSDTGRPWPEPQLETLNSRWWAVCTEWKAGVPVQEARSPQQPSPRGDWPALYLARGLHALQHPTCALCPNSHCLTAKKYTWESEDAREGL